MKNKINNFSKGVFTQYESDVALSATNQTLIVGEGELYEGKITLENRKGRDIRGLVYSSSFRMHFEKDGFEGNPITISYTYEGAGLKPGFVEEGKITIVCNGGEYEIPFVALVERPFANTKYGKIQSVDDFKRLAAKDYSVAKQIFRSPDFSEILKYEDERILALYMNMRTWSLDEQGLEEFLVGIKKKERIFLMLPEEKSEYENITDSTKNILSISKNTWGFMPIRFHVIGDFISITKKRATTEEFVGNGYELEYILDEKKLHAGHNSGEIQIETPYETLIYPIHVFQPCKRDEKYRELELMEAQAMKGYLSYLGGKVDVNTWVEQGIKQMKALSDKVPSYDFYRLIQAHMYIKGQRNEEAKWILDNYDYNRFNFSKDPELNGYYLFLTALLKRESSYVNRVIGELEKAYAKEQSWFILWMMLNLDVRYRPYSEKLPVLEREFFEGNNHIIFFTECFICFRERINLLKKIGTFETGVFRFAVKYKIITEDMALQFANLTGQLREFNGDVLRVLEGAYEIYPDATILNAICTMLIKGNKVGHEYFKWYQKAVEEDSKIAKLYEYFMESIDEKRWRGPLPKSIFLYFMYGNHLPYQKEALLYANLLEYEEGTSDMFINYCENISKFAWIQLEKRHVNEQLKSIYKRFCTEKEMNKDRIKAMCDICYSYKVEVKRKNIAYVLVLEMDGTISQRVPYTEEGAIICLYHKESRIVLESKSGAHYVNSVPYETTRLFYEMRFMDMCKRMGEILDDEEDEEHVSRFNLEDIKRGGLYGKNVKEAFKLCSEHIRETQYKEDAFITLLSFELFRRGQYDKILLGYLSEVYCGPTRDMKQLWRICMEQGINTGKLSERIITQVIFTERMLDEEDVFEDYYERGAYFRLKQAYLAYAAKQYFVKKRKIADSVFSIMEREFFMDEELPDVCKVALLNYYKRSACEHKLAELLHKFFLELCAKQIIFPFYFLYPKEWIREVHLYDKTIIQFDGIREGEVKIVYRILSEEKEEVVYREEPIMPVLDTIYVKGFTLFKNESIRYYFKVTIDGKEYMTSKRSCECGKYVLEAGKYGKLNQILESQGDELITRLNQFQVEEELASQLFVMY